MLEILPKITTLLLKVVVVRRKWDANVMIQQKKKWGEQDVNGMNVEWNSSTLSVKECVKNNARSYQQYWRSNSSVLSSIYKTNNTYTHWASITIFLPSVRRSESWWTIICYTGYGFGNIFPLQVHNINDRWKTKQWWQTKLKLEFVSKILWMIVDKFETHPYREVLPEDFFLQICI